MTAVLKLSGVTLPGTGYPNIVSFLSAAPSIDLPVKTGLVGLYILAGNEADSIYNHANSEIPLIKVGLPTINLFGASVSRDNCFNSQLVPTANMTFMAIAKPLKVAANADAALLISNFTTAGPSGDSLGFRGATPSQSGVYGGLTPSGVSQSFNDISTANTANWNFFAGTIDANGAAKPFWGRDGSLVVGSPVDSGDRGVVTSRTLRIGGHYEPTLFGGTASLAMAAIFQAKLSDADIQANYAYLRDVWAPSFSVMTL